MIRVKRHSPGRDLEAPVGAQEVPLTKPDGHTNKVTSTSTNGRQLNWAKIIKLNSPSSREVIPEEWQSKRIKTKKILAQNNLRPLVEPKPTALFLKNVRRGPLGVMSKALRIRLPSWALLGIDFVGSSILEVITDKRLEGRVKATLKIMGIIYVPNLVGVSTKKGHRGGAKI